ncbi:MAG: S8 family serine peptidase [Sedimentisphaerales bacterium]
MAKRRFQGRITLFEGTIYKVQAIILFITLIFFVNISRAADDCNCGKTATNPGEGKFINANEIFKGFEQGSEKVRVIVNLQKPQMLLEKTVNWQSKDSLKQLHAEVKDRQDKVIGTFGSQELALRHRFENQAGFSCEVTAEALDKLSNDPAVESIEPIYLVEKHLAQGIPLINGAIYRSTYNGQGTAIAICDTGIDYTHPMLGGGGFPNSKVIGGYDFGDSDSDPFPTEAHGTCCAGIAAGSLGSTGDYIGGVAYNAKIYALKVEDSAGYIYTDTIVTAWDWCVSHKNDDPNNPILVISTSLGGGRYYSACDSSNSSLATSANNAVAAGITLLVSSGNDGYCDSIESPACLSNVISVGAVYDAAFGTYYPCVNSASCATKYSTTGCDTGWYSIDTSAPDKVTSYSNTASFLSILAPSNQAYTTDIAGSAGYSTGDYYSSFGGTSAASPYAAGAAACLQSAAKAITGSYLIPPQVKSVLTSTGDSITDSKVAITKPRINLGHAIESLVTNPNPCTNVTIGTGTSSWDYPMHTANHDARTQVIYLASEIGKSGVINGLYLNVTTVPGKPMNNWTIRMKYTSLSAYSTCALDANGWTIVYQANEPAGSIGWRLFTFSTPFEYNGTDNLLVDFSYNNTSKKSSGQCRYSTPGGNRSVYASSNSTNGDPLSWSGSSSPTVSCSTYVPNVLFIVCAPVLAAPVLDDEPNITPAACNTISWSLVPLAQNYYAQCSADAGFSVIDANSGWITDSNYQFCSLVSGQWYWYRVKAKNTSFGVESDWSNIVSSRQCYTPGDFQPDCVVDWTDLAVLAAQWLQAPGTPSADIAPQPSGDGIVNFFDLAEFAGHWMQN